MDHLAIWLFFAGLGGAALGYLWLLAAAFRRRVWWGLGSLLPPVGLLFALRHRRQAVGPLVVVLLGGLTVGAAYGVSYYAQAIDLGPRDTLVEGERHLTLTGWDQGDYSVLRQCRDAVVLQMANADVTDQTLEHLRGMDRLRELDLNDTQVTDAGLPVLRGLPALRRLRLRNTQVTDAGFRESLAPHEGLQELDLRGTGVSREAVREWRAAREGRRALQ